MRDGKGGDYKTYACFFFLFLFPFRMHSSEQAVDFLSAWYLF